MEKFTVKDKTNNNWYCYYVFLFLPSYSLLRSISNWSVVVSKFLPFGSNSVKLSQDENSNVGSSRNSCLSASLIRSRKVCSHTPCNGLLPHALKGFVLTRPKRVCSHTP